MSDESWDIAPPPFKADAALQTLKRFARDQRVLAERSEGWLLGAELVLKFALDGDAVQAQLAKRPARTPEWDRFTVRNQVELRKLQDEVKRRLMRWKDTA
jgi:hypothetical protein